MAKKNVELVEETVVVETVVENTEVAAEVVAGGEVVAGEVVGETNDTPPVIVKIDIIRGQMPLPIVHMIKTEDVGITDGTLAGKYRTTNGKINDIRQDKNFGYVVVGLYVPTVEEIAKAKAWAARHEGVEIIAAVDALVAGSAEDRAKFDANKVAIREAAKAAKTPAAPAAVEAAPAVETEAAGDAGAEAELVDTPAEEEIVSQSDLDELTA